MATATKTLAADWSIAYAVNIRRLDNRFMLCLLRLHSWPNLSDMHGDLVDAMTLICSLLETRPMVGFLVARRLQLPVDKTYALLSVLQSKGHIVAVGADVIANQQENTSTAVVEEITLNDDKKSSDAASDFGKDSGDVLNQLWGVLNTDISWSKSNANQDPDKAGAKDAGDVLGQLWRVLNTDIVVKVDANNVPVAATEVEVKPYLDKVNEATGVMGQLWSVLNTDIAFTRQSGEVGIDTPIDAKTKEISSVLGQLWRVLNTEIAVKRQSSEIGANSSSDTTAEANDKLSKLWRILDAEINLKKKDKTYVMSSEGVRQTGSEDTSSDAVSRLSQLWQVLNAEIKVTLPQDQREAETKKLENGF